MKILTLSVTLLLVSCGSLSRVVGRSSHCVLSGKECEDVSPVRGQTGAQGTAGKNGLSIVSQVVLFNSTVACPAGGTVFLIAQDSNEDGIYNSSDAGQQSLTLCNGSNGTRGAAGTNGTNGTNGTDGTSPPYSSVSTIAPCGIASSPTKEVLLCLNSGSVLRNYSDTLGVLNTRLAIISSGIQRSIDGSSCAFSTVTNSAGDTTVSWSAGSNAFSTYPAQSVICKAH